MIELYGDIAGVICALRTSSVRDTQYTWTEDGRVG